MAIRVPDVEEWGSVRQSSGLATEIKNMCDAADALASEGTDIWDWFRNWSPPPGKGYMWCDHPCKDKLLQHPTVNLSSHSGASLAMCMRQVQAIAKVGFWNWNKN